jgi:Tfp pilus assembly protein PilF
VINVKNIKRQKSKIIFMKIYICVTLILCFCYSCNHSETKKSLDSNLNDKQIISARSYYEENNYSKALILLDSITIRDTTNGEVYYMRGVCHGQLSDKQSSVKDFVKAIMLNYRQADAYYNLGLCEIALLNDSSAVYYLKKSIELDPEKYHDVRRVLIDGCEERIKKWGK